MTLAGQTPVTSSGLGYPVPPVDARASALGSTGIGLLGGSFAMRNPADLTEHEVPGISISIAPEGVTLKLPDAPNETTGRQRFTVIRAIVPFNDWAVAFGFGPELDQDWSIDIQDTLSLGIGTYPIEEQRSADGGMSTIDLSLARRVGPISLGVGVQRITGSVRQSFRRIFDVPLEPESPILADVADDRLFSYRGWRLKAGANINVSQRFMLSGSVGFTGDITAKAEGQIALVADSIVSDTLAARAVFDGPVIIEGGASALLARELILTAAGGWTGYSSLNSGLELIRADDILWGGAGIEYGRIRTGGLRIPIRFGARFTQLPFSVGEEGQVTERALSLGGGLVFRRGLAEFNGTFEIGNRGDRDQSTIEETFRRLTVSFTLRQPLSR